MIDCPNGDLRDALPDYVNDRLHASRRVEVERHLEACAACRDEVELLCELRAAMRRSPTVNADAIAAAIPPYRAPVRRGWTTGWRAAAAIAAITVGGASIALLRDDAPTDRGVERTAIASPSRERIDSAPTSVLPSVAQVPRVAAPFPSPDLWPVRVARASRPSLRISLGYAAGRCRAGVHRASCVAHSAALTVTPEFVWPFQ